jgi:hypothetical protein
MAVKDDLRRLSEMQAIYLSWQSFFAQVCAADSLALTATANKETCGTPQPSNQSPSQNIVHLSCAKMGAPANVENRLTAPVFGCRICGRRLRVRAPWNALCLHGPDQTAK